MPLTVVLAVGLDSSLLADQSSIWQSAGYVVTSTNSIREAIVHIRDGDFDLVLLGNAIPTDSRERFAFLVRAIGSRTPVISITGSPSHRDIFADATIAIEPAGLLQSIDELMADRSQSMSRIEPCRPLLQMKLGHSAFESAGLVRDHQTGESGRRNRIHKLKGDRCEPCN